jgi:hypothetical protein
MNINEIERLAEYYHKTDKRISYDRALSEAIQRAVIIDLDNKKKLKTHLAQKNKVVL